MRNYILLILIFFTACKKTPKYTDIYEPDKALLAHFNYKPGSYWILEDSATGRLDSLYVTTNKRLESVHDYTKLRIYYQIEFGRLVNGIDTLDWKLLLEGNHGQLFEFRYNGRGEFNNYPSLFIYPFVDTNYTLGDTMSFHFLPWHFAANGQYMNVLQVHNYLNIYLGADDMFKPHDHWLWFNEAYGFIKMSLRYHDGKQICWTLKRRKIVL